MNIDKKIKLIGVILGVVLFIVLIAGASYAWFSWLSGNTVLSGKSGCFPDINYTNGTSLNRDNILLFDEDVVISDNKILVKNGMALLGITAGINDECSTPVKLDIELNVTALNNNFISGDSVGAFKYVLAKYDPSTYSSVNELVGQSLEILQHNSITSTGKMSFDNSVETLTTDTSGYVLIFYIDGDNAFNGVDNSTFKVSIIGKAVQIGK